MDGARESGRGAAGAGVVVAVSASKMAEIEAQRATEYGEAQFSHQQIGRVWAAMLSRHLTIPVNDIPPRLVALMMTALKVMRVSGPDDQCASEDTYDDLAVYAGFARRWDRRWDHRIDGRSA